LFFCTGMVQGRMGPFRIPFPGQGEDACKEGEIETNCMLGALDSVQRSYSGENPTTMSTFQQRRTGRVGSVFVVMGSYLIMTSLKLLVPGRESNYYKKEDPLRSVPLSHTAQEMGVTEPGAHSGTEQGQSEVGAGGEEEEDIAPIFVTHLWKRSCLALLMFSNVVLQQAIVQYSFSDLFKQNVMVLLIASHFLRGLVKHVATGVMCDVMLVLPLHCVSQITYLVTLNANPTLFDFIVSYMVVLCIQMIDRVYIGPSEEMVIHKISKTLKGMSKYLESIRQLRTGPPEAENDDMDATEGAAWADPNDAGEVMGDIHDHDTEGMMSFCASLSTDAIGDLLAPIFFMVCRWQYDESQLLYSYRVNREDTMFYVLFYFVMLFFQTIINALSINVVETFHGWNVLDYFEYCDYRYKARTTDWKGRDNTFDEAVSPQMRSLDQMCFSDQYIFMLVLNALGVLSWLFGMQIIFVNSWNVFDDPATPPIIIGALGVCRGSHKMVMTSAGYLKIWVADRRNLFRADPRLSMMDAAAAPKDSYTNGVKPPAPPPGSIHEGWVEPTPRDAKGMERYRAAFLLENQLWLQSTFAELRDKKLLVQNRETVISALTALLGEVPPERYGPQGEAPPDGFRFGDAPPQALAIAAGEVQREDFQGSLCHSLVKMWRERAQFMLLLSRVSQMVKIDNVIKAAKCEICGNTQSLLVTPIATLTNLASMYRIQRDMSPLWNMPLWRHYYQTFTQACTICSRCASQYYRMNKNIPVEEKRFRKYQTKKRNAYDLLEESKYGLAILEPEVVSILNYWLSWTKNLARNEEPKDFLLKYGFENRTFAEIKREEAQKKKDEVGEDDEFLPQISSSSSDDGAALAQQAQASRIEDVNLGEEEELQPAFGGRHVPLSWPQQAVALAWLHKARQNLRAPHLNEWAHLVPKAPPARPVTPPGGGDAGSGPGAPLMPPPGASAAPKFPALPKAGPAGAAQAGAGAGLPGAVGGGPLGGAPGAGIPTMPPPAPPPGSGSGMPSGVPDLPPPTPPPGDNASGR